MMEKKMDSIIIKCELCGHISIIDDISDAGRYFFAQCLNLNPDCQAVYLFDLKIMKHRMISMGSAKELHSEMVKSGFNIKYFTNGMENNTD